MFLIIFIYSLIASVQAEPFYRQEFLSSKKGAVQNAKKVTPPLKSKNFLIMLDPGHGGHDVGTQSNSEPRYQEKSLNLVTARFVKKFLEQSGYQVEMTRRNDSFVSLTNRAQMANDRNSYVFVSIHYNSAPSAQAKGIEVFFYQSQEEKERTAKSKRLAHTILRSVLAHTKARSRGVKHANYAVIRETKMPAILIEGGFVTNEAELENLKDPTYLKRLAWGIARGIEEYIRNASAKNATLSTRNGVFAQ